MPTGYRPRVPLQRSSTPWLTTDAPWLPGQDQSYSPPASVGGVNSVTLPAGVKSNRFAYNTPPVLKDRLPSVRLDNVNKPGIDWKGIGSKLESTGKAIAPFASNIINSFRKPPKPGVPRLNSFTNLSKINLDDERNRVSRGISNSDVSAERNLDANTAAAVKANNLGTKLDTMSSISERESNANVGIANQQAQMDMQTQFSNNAKLDDYDQTMVERNIAQQREQTQNIANAGDKYLAIQNEKNKAAVDLSKTQMMAHAFDQSQVLNRMRAKARAAGETDPLGRNYKDLDDTTGVKPIFKTGGRLPMKRLI